MKTRLNKLHRIGYSNRGIAKKLNMSVDEVKSLNSNDKKFLDLIKKYNKNQSDRLTVN